MKSVQLFIINKVELQLISIMHQKCISSTWRWSWSGDRKYKILKKIFTNPICQWLFRWLHPDIGIKIAQLWSRHSFTDPSIEVFHGEDKEWLIQYCKRN
jgi:hypothetical protein